VKVIRVASPAHSDFSFAHPKRHATISHITPPLQIQMIPKWLFAFAMKQFIVMLLAGGSRIVSRQTRSETRILQQQFSLVLISENVSAERPRKAMLSRSTNRAVPPPQNCNFLAVRLGIWLVVVS
jgi:hypothetical protein